MNETKTKKPRNSMLPRSANRNKYQPKIASLGIIYSSVFNTRGFRGKFALESKKVNAAER